MHSVENYLVTNFNAIVLSKTTVPCISTFPRIKKLQFYFIIGVSSYKKNFLLFYIVLSILFGGVGSIKKKKVGQVRIITLVVKKQKVAFL